MSTTNQNIINPTWKEIKQICIDFCENNTTIFDCIIAITRGGLIPAVIISHHLGIRIVYPIQIYETIDDNINSQKTNPILGNNIDFSFLKNKSILIVDDIIGSGATLDSTIRLLIEYTKNIKSFVCFCNHCNYSGQYELPNYIGEEVLGWVIFPWEKNEHEW